MKSTPTFIWTAGQITALLVQESIEKKEQLAQMILCNFPIVDQVGFLSTNCSTVASSPAAVFTMMGGELSINGCIAAGYELSRLRQRETVSFSTSCLSSQIVCSVNPETTSVDFPSSLIKSIDRDKVILQGIRYQLIAGIPIERKLTVFQQQSLNEMLTVDPAAGLVFYQGKRIVPVVAVRDTNTLYWEQACGSGSLAYYAISGIKKVRQPSGEFLTISASDQSITIATRTKEIYL